MMDHPIFLESIRFIRKELVEMNGDPLQKRVIERMIHTCGDFGIQSFLRFSPNACQLGLRALKNGAQIIADTSMATVAIQPMAKRTINASVHNILDWAPNEISKEQTRSALGMKNILKNLDFGSNPISRPIFVIGSAPTALETLLDLVSHGNISPSLIIGMPVGFVGVAKSKERLIKTDLPFIVLEGTRGGAALAASVVNSLMRESIK